MNFARVARPALALMLLVLAGVAGSAPSVPNGNPQRGWTETSWPFLLDEWGIGQAFRCEESDCGVDAQLFVRLKRGFCNCFEGVADDAEVDRLTDFEFLGGASRPLGAGRPIRFGDMSGRTRSFAVDSVEAPSRRAVSFVVAKKCDALVATMILNRPTPAGADATMVNLLPRTMLADLP